MQYAAALQLVIALVSLALLLLIVPVLLMVLAYLALKGDLSRVIGRLKGLLMGESVFRLRGLGLDRIGRVMCSRRTFQLWAIMYRVSLLSRMFPRAQMQPDDRERKN